MALINLNKPFLKIPWSKRAVSYYILLLLNTFLYALIFDEPRLMLYEYSPKDIALIIICAALFNLFLFFILMLSKWVFVIVNPLLYYFGAVGVIYADKFHLDTTILSAPKFLLHNTISSSISSNFAYILFITLMFLLGLGLGFLRFFFARDKSVIRRGQVFALIFIISSITYSFLYNNFSNVSIQPYAFLKGAKDYLVTSLIYKIQFKDRKDMITAQKTDDNITGIVILVDKISNKLYSSNIKAITFMIKENIIKYNGFKSEFNNNNITRSAVMTGAAADKINNYTDSTSFISVLKNAGYNTAYIGIYNSLLSKDNYNYYLVENDTENIYEQQTNNSPNLFRSISYINDFLKSNKGGIIVVNAEGSAPYIEKRYKDFITTTSENEYDNYISYINAYIKEVISLLKDKDAFVIIQGLEGETVNNGISVQDEESVMLVWVSDTLENKYMTRSRFQSNIDDKIVNNTLYYSILGCFELKSKTDFNKIDRNICRQKK